MSFASYLTDALHCDPRVVDFYTAYTVDCMGGTPHHVNAHSVISFISTDYTEDVFAYPGGTSEVARGLIGWLIRGAHALTMRLEAGAPPADAGERRLFPRRRVPPRTRQIADHRCAGAERPLSGLASS